MDAWLLSKSQLYHGDSKPGLEALGFTDIVEHDDLIRYRATPPAGWTQSVLRSGWTTVHDQVGRERIVVFYKVSLGEIRSYLTIRTIVEEG